MLWQPQLPEKYMAMSPAELHAAITRRRAELGSRLIILGHHYQQDEVVCHADFLGDSFKLSQLAAQQVKKSGAKFVVFCGVHFMAESADILTPDDVAVILPDLSAGCSMADMAPYDQTLDCWNAISGVLESHSFPGRVIPITYMNSAAAIKAFVGEHGGAVCTSSNARLVLEWAMAGGTQPKAPGEKIKILFLPDQHLGRNVAASMGLDVNADMALWDPKAPDGLGGNSEQKLLDSQVILWKGHCSVHKLFRPEHVLEARRQHPGIKVIVHPECCYEVVQLADMAGSTESIIRTIQEAPAGSSWAIGTEVHQVARLTRQHPDKFVRILSDCQCLCTTMYRIDPQHLLHVLDNLAEGRVVNQIKVHPQVRHWSLAALDRMLQITGSGPPTAVKAQTAGV